MNYYFDIIEKVFDILDDFEIPYEFNYCEGGFRLTFQWCKGWVTANPTSFTGGKRFPESYRFPWDDGNANPMEPKTLAHKIVDLYYGMEG